MNQQDRLSETVVALDGDLLAKRRAILPIPGAEASVSILRSTKSSAFFLAVFSGVLALSLGLSALSANAQTNSTWNGGTGNWGDSGNWNPGAVPNNSGTTTYDVKIGAANSNVTMDVLNDTIDNLTLTSKNSLTINAGDNLSLVSGTSFNSGTINVLGSLSNGLGDAFTNIGTINNSGALNNSGTITNRGALNNTASAAFTNDGTLT